MNPGTEVDAQESYEMHEWVYAGVRQTNEGKLAYSWINHHGNEVLFTVKGEIIGGIYAVECLPSGIRMRSKVTLLRQIEDERIARWDLLGREAATLHARVARVKKYANKDPLDNALRPVKKILDGCPNGVDRAACVAYIIDSLYRRLK